MYEGKCIGSNKHLPLKFMSKKSIAALSEFPSRAVVLHRLHLLRSCSFLLLASPLRGWTLGDLSRRAWSFLPHTLADRNALWYYRPDNCAVGSCLRVSEMIRALLWAVLRRAVRSVFFPCCGDTSAPFMPDFESLLGRTRSTYCRAKTGISDLAPLLNGGSCIEGLNQRPPPHFVPDAVQPPRRWLACFQLDIVPFLKPGLRLGTTSGLRGAGSAF